MASKSDHLERTATEPRDKSLNTVILEHIEQINDTTRIFRLGIPRGSPPFRFLPGQWLDVYVPGVPQAGGFTITSAPREACLAHPTTTAESEGADDDGGKTGAQGPYIELAVQKSPDNPPAAWLWRSPQTALLGAELRVRVGGSFVWPPPGINVRARLLRRVVFVAGGVGVNPLVAMLSSLASSSPSTSTSTAAAAAGDFEVRFLYSLKDPGVSTTGTTGERGTRAGARDGRKMLFLERIARMFREGRVKGRLEVFLTGGTGEGEGEGEGEGNEDGNKGNVISFGEGTEGSEDTTIPFHARRCTVEDDVAKAVGETPAERRFAVVYVCGVPTMTDEFVRKLTDRQNGLGMEPHRVLCEKWW
ncbi:hypothetical protein GGR51DRAFT_406695 [Nemania sp. FL0031]|nr:hypothetical protein GGR51DRAFT_406695 [Nemania sp. FL0031]